MIRDIRDGMMEMASFGLMASAFAGQMKAGDPLDALTIVGIYCAICALRLTQPAGARARRAEILNEARAPVAVAHAHREVGDGVGR